MQKHFMFSTNIRGDDLNFYASLKQTLTILNLKMGILQLNLFIYKFC